MRIMKDNLGRLAIWRDDKWVMFAGVRDMEDVEVNKDDWTELYVTELPKPDSHWVYSANEKMPVWDLGDGTELAISYDLEGITMSPYGTRYDIDVIEKEALVVLAAVTALRKIQKERDVK